MKVYVVTTNVVTGFNYTLDDLVEETTAETESTETAETAKMESENSEACNGDNGNCSGGSRLGMLPTNDNDVI